MKYTEIDDIKHAQTQEECEKPSVLRSVWSLCCSTVILF